MARRKRHFMDEGDSSSGGDSDASIYDEFAHEEGDGGTRNGSARRRARRSGKEDAIYGIFGDGDEGENEREGGAGRTVRARNRKGQKVNYLRGQAFVSASTVKEGDSNVTDVQRADMQAKSDNEGEHPPEDTDSNESSEEGASDDDDLVEDAGDPATSRPSEQRQGLTSSARGGIGSSKISSDNFAPTDSPQPGHGSTPPAFTRGGIGSGRLGTEDTLESASGLANYSNMRSRAPVFAKASNISRASDLSKAQTLDDMRTDNAAPASPFDQSPLPATQDQDGLQQATATMFSAGGKTSTKNQTSSGGKFDPSKYLAAMGWSGGGLGKQGEGIINPIEIKQRPERAGIAFGGLREKTKQAKEEARRRGEEVSSDEENVPGKRQQGKGKQQKQRQELSKRSTPQAWTKAEKKPRKPKIEHRSYEQILEEHGHPPLGDAGIGPILDAAGNEYSSMSAALAKHSVPTAEETQLIEIRHNLQVICDANRSALDSLASEGAHIVERHKWLERDRDESVRRRSGAAKQAVTIKTMLTDVRQIEALGRRAQSDANIDLIAFEGPVLHVCTMHSNYIEEYGLDEAVVGAFVPIFRRCMAQWNPLADPTVLTASLQKLKLALRIGATEDVMTPYDTLLWNIWMPSVRSAINNDWDVRKPEPVIALMQAWSPLLPPFIRDNLTQQLILPKVRAAVSDWDGKDPLYKVIFPWMPILGGQMDDVVAEAKRRLRGSLKSWSVHKGVPSELQHWRDVLSTSEWDSMLLRHVVDKLASYLQKHLSINPQAQDVEPLEQVIVWKSFLAPKIISKLLLARFVPAWLDTLHAWLKSADVNFEEVAHWYEHWKNWFQARGAFHLDGVQSGFNVALQLMDTAISLGDKRASLPLPDLKALHRSGHKDATAVQPQSSVVYSLERSKPSAADVAEPVSFRQVVEDAAAAADLLVMPLNRTELKSGTALYRISRNIDGKGGITFYIEEDVVFAECRGNSSAKVTYEPLSIEELLHRAK